MNQRRFVVLDRDGTIIEERHYLSDPDQIKLIPGAAGALRALKKLGLGLVVVTNQSAVGRGFFSEARLTEIHQRLLQMLAAENVEVDGVYFCPHVPDDRCLCRKPQVGMVQKAAQELSFDLDQTMVIGDKASDIEMGRRVGATTFLVRTGYGAQIESSVASDHVVDDLAGAAAIIESLLGKEGNAIHDY